MELLKEIVDTDFGLESVNQQSKHTIRKASRAVVFNECNQVALLFVSKHNYHKLPGGGVEQEESLTEALIREVLEEVGAEINIVSNVGMIVEYRSRHELVQESCCYIAKVYKIIENQSLTEEEISDGFILKWVSLEKAIALLQEDKPKDYMGLFIQKRDYTFLTEARDYLYQ